MVSLRTCLAMAALAIALSVVAGCAKKAPSLAAGATVLALGDSLTFGTGAATDTAYPAILAASTGWNVINAGIPGSTAQEGCDRLPSLLADHRPRLLLVFLGGNDILRRQSAQSMTDGLARCVRDARAAGLSRPLISTKFYARSIKSKPESSREVRRASDDSAERICAMADVIYRDRGDSSRRRSLADRPVEWYIISLGSME